VILDPEGNLYGTAGGGAANAGLVFKLDPAGDYTVLYTFNGGSDGSQPNYGLVLDSAGNLYGTTREGGAYASVPPGWRPAGPGVCSGRRRWTGYCGYQHPCLDLWSASERLDLAHTTRAFLETARA
jgi:uncharacterized repeat protein (TIGR03803 family)